MTTDPFAQHPDPRDKIEDPMQSFFRTFQPSDFDERMQALGFDANWRYSDAEREARRLAFLGPRLAADIWVFAFGSLMWNPGFRFAEVRLAHAPFHARRFCLLDTFNFRGSRELPGLMPGLMAGLMAGLDAGAGCGGLACRIAAGLAEVEAELLWRREAVAPAYSPRFIAVDTAQGPVEALTFVANHAAQTIAPNLSHQDQVRYLATGRGEHGTSMDYLERIAAQLAVLGIDDPDVARLLADARAYR